MPVKQRRYPKEEFARRGDEIYDRAIRAQVEPAHDREFVAIDIESGEWEIDADQEAASDRLEARLPDAQIYLLRVGVGYITRFGAGRSKITA